MTSDRMPSSNDGLPESGATLRSRTVSGSIWTLFGTLAGAPAGLVATLLTARFLGVSGFGRYALLMYVSTLATALSELGMTTILQRRVALAFGRGDRREELLAAQQALVAIAFRLIAMFAVCLVLIQDPLALTLVAASAVLGVVPASAMVLLTGTSRSAIMAKTALASTLLGELPLESWRLLQ